MLFMSQRLDYVPITSCGSYYPTDVQRIRGRDQVSCFMMDFKNSTCRGHQRSINYFGNMLIQKVESYIRRAPSGVIRLVDTPVQIAIVPSHSAGHVSPALLEIAKMLQRLSGLSHVEMNNQKPLLQNSFKSSKPDFC